ncbi:hypothetical protein V6N11_029629 [Hibiscus sabdariffa]|uniref:Uncharacterized protein n=1 Tax=Hibiscus sabdariffa TaxID=183260 RepID=A0ABR2P7A4_9ROSI
MNGAKRSAEAVGCKNASVGERSALGGSTRVSGSRRSGSENVGLSNANIVLFTYDDNGIAWWNLLQLELREATLSNLVLSETMSSPESLSGETT